MRDVGWEKWYALKNVRKKFQAHKMVLRAFFSTIFWKNTKKCFDSIFKPARAGWQVFQFQLPGHMPGHIQMIFLDLNHQNFQNIEKYVQRWMFYVICLVKSWNICILLSSHIMNAYQHNFWPFKSNLKVGFLGAYPGNARAYARAYARAARNKNKKDLLQSWMMLVV